MITQCKEDCMFLKIHKTMNSWPSVLWMSNLWTLILYKVLEHLKILVSTGGLLEPIPMDIKG